MKYNPVLSRNPFKQLWKIWNPFRVPDKTGGMITDVFTRRRSKKTSKRENEKRIREGKRGPKCFSVKIMQSIDMSGKSD